MINQKLLQRFKDDYNQNPYNHISENAIKKVGIKNASFNNNLDAKHPFLFSLETSRGKITNQKKSGRCWMFAALNTARIEVMNKLNLDTFEFSQNYPLFYDKLEKSNYFLESILETLDEKTDSRLIMHLLKSPVEDGGQWDMFAGLLKKYGAVPKSVMPESFHSSDTLDMRNIITSKLREYACSLRQAHKNNTPIETLYAMKEEMLSHIYSILVKCLGPVPETFDFEYRDKNNKFHRIENITPQQFFNEYVGWNLDDKVSLINAPTADKPYYRAYTVKYLGSVKEANPICYINVTSEELKEATIKMLKDNKPVWFGCDVGQQSARDLGYLDAHCFEYEKTLNEGIKLNKAQRLEYGESLLTHAMVFTGVNLDKDGNPITWQVENSWGDAVGSKGIFSMSDEWFDEYNYQVLIDKKYLSSKILNALEQPIIELEPWDPMGSLAK